MTKFIDPEQATNVARALQDERMESVRELVQTQNRVNEIREQADEAERAHARAWIAATQKGWSEDELRRIGLTEPTKVGAPKRRRAAAKPSTD